MGYREYRRQISPPWLLGKFGAALQEVLGSIEDGLVARAKAAVMASFPGFAPSDALPVLGDEMCLPRLPGETDDGYRSKLLAAFDIWRKAATIPGFYLLFERSGYRIRIIEAREFNLSGDTSWGRDHSWFALAILPPHQWTDDGMWSDDEQEHWKDKDDRAWGCSATIYEIGILRRMIRDFKPASSGAVPILAFDPELATLPPSEWTWPLPELGEGVDLHVVR